MDDTPYFLDLGDFVPEEYVLEFSIRGNKYRFEYGEASTEDVLRFMLQSQKESALEKTRDTVTQFLKLYVVTGDPEQLEKDLALVPYRSQRGGLDLETLLLKVSSERVKKNEPGAGPETTTASEPPGSPGK